MWLWLVIWIVILVFNTVHSFLPNKLQGKKWIRITAMIIASLILIRGVIQEIATVKNRSYAYISADAEIIERKNFSWKVSKTSADNLPIYIIEELYGDATKIKIEPDRHVKFKIYNAIDGVAIKFYCQYNQVPSFWIRIGP
jgi:hypothetical protein